MNRRHFAQTILGAASLAALIGLIACHSAPHAALSYTNSGTTGTATIGEKKAEASQTVTYTVGQFIAPARWATWIEKLTKNGHYVATFDDPKNEWTCAATLVGENGVIITCTRKHEVEKEKP